MKRNRIVEADSVNIRPIHRKFTKKQGIHYKDFVVCTLDFCRILCNSICEVSAMKFNNLKQIREIYGATQEQIARALSVNRVTVANWESGSTIASNANREKMSIYYGIGPEFFYEQELTEEAKEQILQTAAKERAIVKESSGRKNKQEDFERMFRDISFSKAMRNYMVSMKILLAKADEADMDRFVLHCLSTKRWGGA